MINNLPIWKIPDTHPCVYDSESATAIEMVAKIYGKMKELVENYNKYVNDLNKSVAEFEERMSNEDEIFRVGLRQEFQDFIDIVNLKIKALDNTIEKTLVQMSENLEEACQTVLNNGISIRLEYDQENESLDFLFINGEGSLIVDNGNEVEY